MFLNILMSEHQSVVSFSFIELSTDENKGYRIRKNVSKDRLIILITLFAVRFSSNN